MGQLNAYAGSLATLPYLVVFSRVQSRIAGNVDGLRFHLGMFVCLGIQTRPFG